MNARVFRSVIGIVSFRSGREAMRGAGAGAVTRRWCHGARPRALLSRFSRWLDNSLFGDLLGGLSLVAMLIAALYLTEILA